ncbi:Holliday junction resolvase RuvX [Candidatus Poribacteria bacterium]|nr:MAG: Holliday junction resolvase RuvX [Candidatus Poribacteria bacterium]
MSVLLGLDVGDVRIGVAISDILGSGAHPLCTLTRTNRQRDVTAIGDLVSIHNVERIIIGLPVSLDGTLGTQAEKVQQFGSRLSKTLGITVEYFDERFTTSEAEEILDLVEIDTKNRKNIIDQVSAVIILDEYMQGNSTDSQDEE